MTQPAAESPRRIAGFLARNGLGSTAGWSLFARYFGRHRNALLAYSIVAALPAVAVVPVLLLVRFAFDTAIPHSDIQLLIWIGAGIVAIRLASILLALALRRYILRLTKFTVAEMRGDLLGQLYRIERITLTRADVDRLQTQVVQDTERLDVLTGGLLSGLLPAAFTSAALMVLLTVLDWQLVLAATVAVPVVLAAASWTQRRVVRDVRVFQSDFERFNRGVSFILRQMDLTRTQAYQRQELTQQQQVVQDLARSGEQMAWSFALHGQLQGATTGVVGILLLVAGGLQVMHDAMTLGQFLAFYLGAGILGGSALSLTKSGADIGAMGVSLDKLAALDATPVAVPYGGSGRPDFAGRLELRDVHFSYGDAPVLRGVDFAVSPGEHVAIVGPNGSGKTTLLNVLLGVLRPQSGTALADSVPYEELDLDHLRRHIGVVLQRTPLFHGTVRANISYGEPDATAAAIREAARLSFASEFIESLPDGFDTLIGDAGISLSGGECQRIALARSMLRNPKVLVLDEPTNHLDASVVQGILQTLTRLPDSPAIIIVSHDPRLVDFVHRAYRLEQGKLIESAAGARAARTG